MAYTQSVGASVELPNFLKTQVREGKVVLVLGAGASQGAAQTHGAKPPNGAQLARLIADHFLGDRFPTAPLSQTSEYAISESSLVEVQEFIRSIFDSLEPATFHRLIPKFRWHGLATTNYDRIIEKAYEIDGGRLQVAQPIISNGDRIQDALRSPDSVLLWLS